MALHAVKKAMLWVMLFVHAGSFATLDTKEVVDHQYDTIRVIMCAAILSLVAYANREVIMHHPITTSLLSLAASHKAILSFIQEQYQYIATQVENPWLRVLGVSLLITYKLIYQAIALSQGILYPYYTQLSPLLSEIAGNFTFSLPQYLWQILWASPVESPTEN